MSKTYISFYLIYIDIDQNVLPAILTNCKYSKGLWPIAEDKTIILSKKNLNILGQPNYTIWWEVVKKMKQRLILKVSRNFTVVPNAFK